MIQKLLSKKPVPVKIQAGPFKGAKMFLNPADSKRKIFGVYEYTLNSWILDKSKGKQFVFDVGANTGYDTYGFAHLLLSHGIESPSIIAFEPEAPALPELTRPLKWPEYKKCNIEIIAKFASNLSDDNCTTLDTSFDQYKRQLVGAGLIKVDVEGAEVDVLVGAQHLLEDPQHDWLIEIHGQSLIPQVSRFFVELNRPFLIKDLVALPIIGAEMRSIPTYWLVTL